MAEGGKPFTGTRSRMKDATEGPSGEDEDETPQIPEKVETPVETERNPKDQVGAGTGAIPRRIKPPEEDGLLIMHDQLRRSMDLLTRSVERIALNQNVPVINRNDGQPPVERIIEEPVVAPAMFGGPVNNRMRRKFLEPKKFKGEGMVWEEYLIKFELVGEWNRWTEDEACEFLMLSLEGDAALHVHGMESFRDLTYDRLCDVLSDRFGANRTQAEDKRKFRFRKKMKGETYAHMAQDLRRLARRIYRGDGKLAEQEAKEQFLRGLPKGVKLAVTAANPETIDDCVDNVAQIQVVLDSEELDEGAATVIQSRMVRTEDEQPKDGNPSTYNNQGGHPYSNGGQYGRGRGRGQNRGRGRGRGRGKPWNYGNRNSSFDVTKEACWNCNEIGHLKSDCPHPWGYKYRNKSEKRENDGEKQDTGNQVVKDSENSEGSSQ